MINQYLLKFENEINKANRDNVLKIGQNKTSK